MLLQPADNCFDISHKPSIRKEEECATEGPGTTFEILPANYQFPVRRETSGKTCDIIIIIIIIITTTTHRYSPT